MTTIYKGYELNDYNQEPWFPREIALFKKIIDAIEALTLPTRDPNLVLFGDFQQNSNFVFSSGNLGVDTTAPQESITVGGGIGSLGFTGGSLINQDGQIYQGNDGVSLTIQPGYHDSNFPKFVQMLLNAGQTNTQSSWGIQNSDATHILYQDASGNMGLSTQAPDCRLVIYDENTPPRISINYGNEKTQLITGADNTSFLNAFGASDRVIALANPVTRMTIGTDGTTTILSGIKLMGPTTESVTESGTLPTGWTYLAINETTGEVRRVVYA